MTSTDKMHVTVNILVLKYTFCYKSLTNILVLQILAFRRYYFKDYWNLLDLFIVILSLIDIIIDQAVEEGTGNFSPSILKVAKVFRVLRMGRLLRLFKVGHLIYY